MTVWQVAQLRLPSVQGYDHIYIVRVCIYMCTFVTIIKYEIIGMIINNDV